MARDAPWCSYLRSLLVAAAILPTWCGVVRVLRIDPASTPCSAQGLLSAIGIGSELLCVRSGLFMSEIIVDTGSAMRANANVKGLRTYNRIVVHIEAFEKGSMDAFATGIRDVSSLSSINYVDGISITKGAPRVHILTFAVGLYYDYQSGTTSMCPCIPHNQALLCGGSSPEAWLPYGSGASVFCDSGSSVPSNNWAPRRMIVDFDNNVSATSDNISVRLMADQVAGNEDVGVNIMTLDIYEGEDNDPPIVTCLGPQRQTVSHLSSFTDPGAACNDVIDGVRPIWVVGQVNTAAVGPYEIDYYCKDTHENIATCKRYISVFDTAVPVVRVRENSSQTCILQGTPYFELGAWCDDENDPVFEALVTGIVDSTAPGTYVVSYTCTDFSNNTASVQRNRVVFSAALPGNLMVLQIALLTSNSDPYTLVSARSVITGVNPSTELRLSWSQPIALQLLEKCRYLTILRQGVVIRRYQSVDLSPASVSGTTLTIAPDGGAWLEKLSTYTIVVDEHYLLNAGLGSLRQVLTFSTGDFDSIGVLQTQPVDGYSSWSLSSPPRIVFNKALLLGSGKVRIRQLVGDHRGGSQVESETYVPCNGSSSLEGLSLVLANPTDVQVSGLLGWSGWRSCREYQFEFSSDCVQSSNHVGSSFNLRFVTSCVVSVSPLNGASNVDPGTPVVLSFVDPVQAGHVGTFTMEAPGELPLTLTASQAYPYVYIASGKVTIDLLCSTKNCSILAAYLNSTSSPPLGNFCGGVSFRRCWGQFISISVGQDFVRFANASLSWSNNSILGLLGDALPAQLHDSHSFQLRIPDFSKPVPMDVEAIGVSESEIQVIASFNEPCAVSCAATSDAVARLAAVCTNTSLVLLADTSSTNRCSAFSSTTNCAGCDHPRYSCSTRSSVTVTGGCSGVFLLEGQQTQCTSEQLESTIYQNGMRNVLTAGQSHTCAIRKIAGAQTLRCWGDPTRIGVVPNVTVSSVVGGYAHSCAISPATGGALCFGLNLYGETASRPGPFSVITAGSFVSAGLHLDGTVEVWGLNAGSLFTPPPGVQFVAIAAGISHFCGLRPVQLGMATNVLCWGSATNNKLTPPAGMYMSYSPKNIQLPIASIAAGWEHTCAILLSSAARMVCWGLNTNGSATVPAAKASYGWLQVAAGSYHTCGLRKQIISVDPASVEGEVHCWGDNTFGQANAYSNPSTRFAAVVAGYGHTCGLLLNSGVVVCWGRNDYGQGSPPAGSFGRLDEYSVRTCEHLVATSDGHTSGNVPGEADAGAVTGFDAVNNRYTAVMKLQGLWPKTQYIVHCYALDKSSNGVTVDASKMAVSTLDQTPPTIVVVSGVPIGSNSVKVVVLLSEPGVAHCQAVLPRAPRPSEEDIKFSQFYAPVDSSLLATIVIIGLNPDSEYVVYCGGRDAASRIPGSIDNNWVPADAFCETYVQTKGVIEIPVLLGISPAKGTLASCAPDGISAGCMPTIVLTFLKDVLRGSGNISIHCVTGACQNWDIPIDKETFPGGLIQFLNTQIRIIFLTPLVDNTIFKMSITEGSVLSYSGAPWGLPDMTCPAWFKPEWQGRLSGCAHTYTFTTPS